MPYKQKALGPVTFTRETHRVRSLLESCQSFIRRDPLMLKGVRSQFAGCRIETLLEEPKIPYQVNYNYSIPYCYQSPHGSRFLTIANCLDDALGFDRMIPIRIIGENSQDTFYGDLKKYPDHLWYYKALHIDSNHWSEGHTNIAIHSENPYEEQLDVEVRLIPVKENEQLEGIYTEEVLDVKIKYSFEDKADNYPLLYLDTPEHPMTFKNVARCFKGFYFLVQEFEKRPNTPLPMIPPNQAFGVRIHGDIINRDTLDPAHCLEVKTAPVQQTIQDPFFYNDEVHMLRGTSTTLVYQNALLEVKVVGTKALTWTFH